MKKILEKDKILIKALRQDSRASLTQISKRTRIPISTLYDRLRYHQGELIKKHTSILDFSLLGYNSRIQLLIKSSVEKKEELKKFLNQHENINNISKISGGYDYLVEGYFQDIIATEDFLEEMEEKFNVTYDAHYIVEDIKREGLLAV